ncbi:MAG: T9SS type A sorting domain-containing protein [Bacteroidetes bacterium]|nr:T9SS type A sorting domain-containing protein [Bacteroidota bacterium]MBL0065641.1 T9SS type A sorting domain-containing protein [Bacteroidota bacterium]
MKHLYLLLLIASMALHSFAQQATLCPLNMGLNRYPIYLSAPEHDVLWTGTYGWSSGGQYNSKVFARTTDRGVNWTQGVVADPEDRGITCFFALNSDVAWAGLVDVNQINTCAIWKTIDGGQNWTRQNDSGFTYSASAVSTIYFFNADSGVAIGGPVWNNPGYYLETYTTTDGGDHWQSVDPANMPAVNTVDYTYNNGYAARGNSIWIPTGTGKVIYSHDRGYTWSVSIPGLTGYTISMTDENDGAFSTSSNNVFYTHDGGMSWSLQTCPVNVYTFSAIPGYANCFVFRSDLGICATVDNFQNYFMINDQLPFATDQLVMYDRTIGWNDAGDFHTDSMMVKIEDVLASVNSPQSNNLNMGLFPNPVSHAASMLSFTKLKAGTLNVKILDLRGAVIQQKQFLVNAGAQAVQLDLHDLSSGMYVVDALTEDGNARRMLVVE